MPTGTHGTVKGAPARRWGRVYALGLTLLALALGVGTGAWWGRAQVLFINQASVSAGPAWTYSSGGAATVQLTATLLRYVPASQTVPSAEALARCVSVEDLVRFVETGGQPSARASRPTQAKAKPARGHVRVLYHASRDWLLASGAKGSFTAQETRPAFVAAAGGELGLTNRQYGLALDVTVLGLAEVGAALVVPPSADASVFLRWEGSFVWSEQLLAKWEQYAVAVHSAFAKVPGVVYESQTEDEDGFVTGGGGGLNLGGLFRKRRRTDAVPGAVRRGSVAGPSQAGSPLVTDEPSYQAEAERSEITLAGEQWLADGALGVWAYPVQSAGSAAEVFYLVLQPRLTD
ncbi:MAG: hypothetical protein FJ387_09675 [Verrucomicrobia bacterium]|nr:hypothetical protein [Verrucomicrobiota bacterium]